MSRTVLALLAIFAALVVTRGAGAATYYVAPSGNDNNPGTEAQPLATLDAARDVARKTEAGPHRIVMMPGEYFLEQTFQLDARDNGLTIEAAEPGKSTLYGGTPVSGWKPDGDRFWSAELPGVKEGKWDFRALVVGDRMPPRARLPESGAFEHKSVFDVRWLSSVGGGWERKPTEEEQTTMRYDPKDIPPSLDVNNAEVRIYHMWDESMVGVAANDVDAHTLRFSTPAKSPPGAFGVKKYVIFNTREGMTTPGQWYLDRTAGKLVYWPLPGEDMAKLKVIAPRLERIVGIAGDRKEQTEGITIRGLVLKATTTPLKAGGFGASAFDGAVRVDRAKQCALENLEVACVGGQGILAGGLVDCRVTGCQTHETGACGIRVNGRSLLVANNHIHHIGVYYPSAIALPAYSSSSGDEPGIHLYRNEIHDAPYSGIAGGGSNLLIEENLIYAVMREMQDGGAIYGGMKKSILRGNMVRDVVKMGEGYGVSAYYLDEGATDCIVERNVSFDVARPSHNHITTNTLIRDNVFIVKDDMALSFHRSAGCRFEGNTLFAPGKINVSPPSAIVSWKNNLVFRGGLDKDGRPQAFTIDDAMPATKPPGRMSWSASAVRVEKPPVFDGEIGSEEWPGNLLRLDRQPSRWSASGAPVFAEAAYDSNCLYVAINAVTFDAQKIQLGAAWGQDDGAELALAGRTADGKPATFVFRGFPDGMSQSLTVAGAPPETAERLGQAVRFVAKPYGKTRGGWRAEWAVPWNALGLKSTPGMKIPFNLTVYRSQDKVWRSWEGTLGESWNLDEAGTLQLK